MLFYSDLNEAARQARLAPGRAATVGFFDGLHVGHRSLLRELRAWAEDSGCEPAVVTFDRHPQEILTGKGPLRILSLEHRLLSLAREGMGAALVLPFRKELSRWTADEFVSGALVEGLGARRLLMGFDGAFGHRRQGTFQYLSGRAQALGIEVRQAGVERLAGERVSSTLVREALARGDLRRLEALLGRRFSLLGKVRTGEGRGRAIGFPTANLDVGGAALPPLGVYFAGATRLGPSIEEAIRAAPPLVASRQSPVASRQPSWAVVNIGKRPTFHDPGRSSETVEAHILDWQGDLYGEYLELELLERHRDERKFPSAAALAEQIRSDVAALRQYLARRG